MMHIQQKGRIWLKALVALVVFLVILAGGVWVWSGSDGSLAQGITLAQRFLAPGQSLSANDVQGSLRHGGHIGSLHWQQEGLSAELNNVDLKWQLSAILGHKLLMINKEYLNIFVYYPTITKPSCDERHYMVI